MARTVYHKRERQVFSSKAVTLCKKYVLEGAFLPYKQFFRGVNNLWKNSSAIFLVKLGIKWF